MTICSGIPAREEDRLSAGPVPAGRFPRDCEGCGMPVLIGPRVAAVLAAGDAVLLCPYCLADALPAGGGPPVIHSLGG